MEKSDLDIEDVRVQPASPIHDPASNDATTATGY